MRFPQRSLLIVLFIGLSLPVQGQRIIAEVNIDSKNIDDAPRQALSYLDQDIKYYIQNTTWSSDELPTDFTIQLTIYLDSYAQTGYQRIYTAKAFIGNNDDQKYFDKSWKFDYNQGDQLLHTTAFNSLTSFIDYYVYLILAGNMDTWTQFGGNQLYSKAQQVARTAVNADLKQGWKERLEDSEYLYGNQDYRKMKFEYYEAIDLWDNGDQESAQSMLDEFFQHLSISYRRQDSRINTQNFLKAKHEELADFIWETERRDLIQQLLELDEDHKDYYQEVIRDW